MHLVQEFEQLWDSTAAPPDVFGFVQKQTTVDADQWLAVLLSDQRRRWLTDNPLKVEDYLTGLPDLPADVDWKLQLAIGEFEARRDTERPLSLHEISSRFADISDTLRERLHGSLPQDTPNVPKAGSGAARELMETKIGAPSRIASKSTYISAGGIGVQEGRYRLHRVLGEGAFGRVHLGFDQELQRQVAIKVPTKARFQKPEDAESYLAEARMVASLDHPHIVSVYDVGRTEDGSIYVVSRFVDGSSLEDRIKAGPAEARDSARLLATVGLALHYAHQKRLIHRDIKPANILIEDSSNTPFVADFGLAIRDDDYLNQSGIAGTPAYMSPEQVRGEGHRIDGRSDIFPMGVILYELLTGRRPFRGSSVREILHQIISTEPKPPRELLEIVPAELERICLKALSKRASDRYATAAEFADDLAQWLKPATAEVRTGTVAQVVPRGLRSFNAGDADFFLDLLPGQRNRDGLPESIAFWKNAMQQTDPEHTFSVGLIYGPSGCGKSSLVKAGMLPHLSDSVIVVYVEATTQETETRILRGLRKRLPELPEKYELARTLAAVRRGQGRKVVIIIDQFEQWLHAHTAEPEPELVKALRQCDGGRLQAIVMVRDDFSMAASRFMQALDTRIVEGHNFATVDLFDVDHARSVLIKFGQAFGKLPASMEDLSDAQRQFVGDVASGLSQDGKVVSVRLALFAEMIKGKSWLPATLQEVGGTEGVGVNFLEETFSSRTSNPKHRQHQQPAREVLKAMLPQVGSDIKGHMRSQAELLEASGYQHRPSDFADLLRILDGELRLITPTDPQGDSVDDSSRDASVATRYYQLTHDYLVPSLREWLTRKQRETRTGRAELKLAERASLWHAKPENRHLPSLTEWLSIRTLTETKNWTPSQRTTMGRAGRVHGLRSLIVLTATIVLIAVGIGITDQTEKRRNKAESTQIVAGLLTAETGQVSGTIDTLKDFRRWADPELKQAFADSPEDANARLHAGLALVAEGQTVDPVVLRFLQERLLTVTPGQFGPVRTMLEPHKSDLIPAYWKLAVDEQELPAQRLYAACALAMFDPENQHLVRGDVADAVGWRNPAFARFIAEQLVTVNPAFVGHYQELLRPVAPHLVPALTEIFTDSARGELAKTLATSLLADYAANDSETLTELVVAADADSDKSLFPLLRQHRPAAVKHLEAVLNLRLKPDWKDAPRDAAWTEPSPAVREQIASAHGLITEQFALCQVMPLGEFLEFAESLRPSGYRPTRIRPHATLQPLPGTDQGRAVNVAAIWTRDTRHWHIDSSLKKSDLPGPDAPATKGELLLADIAPLPLVDEETETQFIALWCEATTGVAIAQGDDVAGSEAEQRRLLLDVTDAELTAFQTMLTEQAFTSQRSITVRTNVNSKRHYTGVWSNTGSLSKLRPAYAGFELVDRPQWDVAVAPPAHLVDPLDSFRQRLANIEELPAERLSDPQLRLTRAAAEYQLGNLDSALADLDFLISKEFVTPSVLQYRTLTLARLGMADEAQQSLEKFLATDAETSFRAYVQIQVPACLGKFQQAWAELESAVTAAGQNTDEMYNVACAAALSSKMLAIKDAAESAKFADRTFELLRQMVALGNSDAEQLKSDVDFAGLHKDPRFLALLGELESPAAYAAVWRADVDFESKLLVSVPLAGLLDQLQPLLAAGYRPFAIAIDPSSVPSPPKSGETGVSASSQPGQTPAERPPEADFTSEQDVFHGPHCSLVLHRPMVPDVAKEALALQQAAAATTLLRLNAAEMVWPLFQDQPDPRVRSYLQHRLATFGVDPQSLFTQLQQESDVSSRRSLILGIGEFARAKLLSPELQAAVIADILKRYSDDPVSGVHGAAEWTLKQLGARRDMAEVQAAYSTGQVVGDRRWYLTKTTQTTHHAPRDAPYDVPTEHEAPYAQRNAYEVGMTFAIIDASEEFLMGSPITEIERYGGPAGENESRHRRHIGRCFAISTHEITVAQFHAFRSDHQFDRTKAQEDDAPANRISWYDAAAYCNWLSEQEDIPREQWCYDPNQPFTEGMSLIPDYPQRNGYRLPSEAEWEYACRAGTTTARFYGETETLLGEYAWYTKTSGDTRMLPVGTLRPNGGGLFDMQGNVFEWCQDRPFFFDTDIAWMEDKEQTGSVENPDHRVFRGGSFDDIASYVRSANRLWLSPDLGSDLAGIRVARTLKSVPMTASPSAGGGSESEN